MATRALAELALLLASRTHPKMSLVPRELMPLLSARSWSLRAYHRARRAFHMSQCEAQAHPDRHGRWMRGHGLTGRPLSQAPPWTAWRMQLQIEEP